MKQNKQKKYFFLILMMLNMILIVITLASCSKIEAKYEKSRSIQDIYSRNITIPDKITKVASVGSAARICTYAGATDLIVAITEQDKLSSFKPYTVACADKFKDLPTTSNGNHLNSTDIDKEKIISINPDIIISTRSQDECDTLQRATGIPVIGVFFQDELFDDSVYKSIQIVGEACQTTTQSSKTIDYIKNTEIEIMAKLQGSQSSTPIYRGAYNYKGSKGITSTISKYCLYKNTSINSVSDIDKFYGAYDTNIEQIITWNPEYIIVDCNNESTVLNDYFKNSAILSNCEAFKNNNVYCVAPFNNNGTNLEYGLCEIFFTMKLLFPDKFIDINLDSKFSEIFTVLDGKDISSYLKENNIKFDKIKYDF